MSRFRLHRTRLLSVTLLAGSLIVSLAADWTAQHAHAQGVRAASLASLVLSASDVRHAYGPGFKVLISRETKNAELRSAVGGTTSSAQLLSLAGRVTGYISMYSHQLISIKGKRVTSKPGVTLVLAGRDANGSHHHGRHPGHRLRIRRL